MTKCDWHQNLNLQRGGTSWAIYPVCSSLLQATRSYTPFRNLLSEGINQILDRL